MIEKNRIPKIIHYCWFGGKEIPDKLKMIMSTWKILENSGYELKCWNESNCSFDENEFVRRAYMEKRWGYLGDYYRAKALYEYGGIYLDTDVFIHDKFDDLLKLPAFIGFSSDCLIGTAIIGAEKGSSFMKGIMNMYDNDAFATEKSYLGECSVENIYSGENWVPSNEPWTWYMLSNIKGFKLNNRVQSFDEVVVFSKKYFELGNPFGHYYCRHDNTNLWRERTLNVHPVVKFKRWLEKNPFFWMMIRRCKSKYIQRKSSLYKYRTM